MSWVCRQIHTRTHTHRKTHTAYEKKSISSELARGHEKLSVTAVREQLSCIVQFVHVRGTADALNSNESLELIDINHIHEFNNRFVYRRRERG